MNTSFVISLLKIIVAAAAIGLIFIGFSSWLNHTSTVARYTAIDNCERLSKVEKTVNETDVVTYPLPDVLNDCLKVKGIQ